MSYLLDTHVILWALDQTENLSPNAEKILSDSTISCYVSIISFFEISIKKKIGKLELTRSISDYINEMHTIGISIIPIKNEHLEQYQWVPLLKDHRDPFDRIIIATAIFEGLSIISEDQKFSNYNGVVQTVW